MPYILALDQGTTSSRAIVFNHDGEIVSAAQKEFRQIFPQPGWVEHDPEEIWATQMGVAAEALARAGVTGTAGPAGNELAAIGIANQRETTVVWDRATGQPVYNAIVWQDRRTAQRMDRLKAGGLEPLIREKTGLVADAYFSGSKVEWILDHVAGARERAEAGKLAFGTIDSWLVYKLTGNRLHATDVSNASRTMLLNIHTGQWDDDLLGIFNIPRAILPEVRASSEVYGQADASLPLPPAPIAGIAGDQQAALIGQACAAKGMAKNTYGTGCFMLMNTGAQAVASKNNLLTTIAWRIGPQTIYALEGSVFGGGAVVQWLRDGLGLIRKAPEVEALANTVADNGGVYFVPAFAGLGAPHWDPYARGTVCGLTRGTTAGHIARAALEAICYQVADLRDAMAADAGVEMSELRVDGGAAANDTLMQMQADILQAPIARPAITETTALGAAYLAGLAVGLWSGLEDVGAHWRMDRRFEPRISPDEVAGRRGRWAEAVRRAKGWAANV